MNSISSSAETKNKRSGQALVEAIAALSLLLVGFLGILGLLARSLNLNRAVTEEYIATYLASEGVEVVKNILDANLIQRLAWGSGFETGGRYEVEYGSLALLPNDGRFLSYDPQTGFYSYNGSRETKFRRTIRIIPVDFEGTFQSVRVNSLVTWTTGLVPHQINLEDYFFDWRPAP